MAEEVPGVNAHGEVPRYRKELLTGRRAILAAALEFKTDRGTSSS